MLLIFVPTMVSLAFTGALAALTGQKISAIALGCGALLVGITVDFGIHILFHADTLGTAHAGKIIKKTEAAGNHRGSHHNGGLRVSCLFPPCPDSGRWAGYPSWEYSGQRPLL